MTEREAVERLFWRFGLFIVTLALCGIAYGALLLAWKYRVIDFPSRYLKWPVYGMAGFVLGGACWLMVTGWREGAGRSSDLSLAADHVGPLAIIGIAWLTLPDTIATDICVCIAALLSGSRSMFLASRNLRRNQS